MSIQIITSLLILAFYGVIIIGVLCSNGFAHHKVAHILVAIGMIIIVVYSLLS